MEGRERSVYYLLIASYFIFTYVHNMKNLIVNVVTSVV